ncbi:MAG: TAXI family TRAP transporter solute-binding subunit [Candidatus Binatia bacterium]
MSRQRITRRQFIGASSVVASAAALSLSGCSAGANDVYTWGAGTKVSSWYPIAAALKTQLSELDIRLQTTGGVSNAALVGHERVDFGFSQDFTLVMAQKGEEPFTQSFDNLRVMFTFLLGYAQYVVRADSGIKRVQDLAGHRVNMVSRQFSTELANEIILKAAGIFDQVDKAYLGYADGAQEFTDGQLDALLYPAIAPNASIQNAARVVSIRLLDFDQALIAKVSEVNPALEAGILREGIYPGVTKPVQTLVTRHVAFTRADMDEDIVYQIVRVAFENKRRIETAHVALRQMSLAAMSGPIAGLTFHPGARRFFKEAGLR